MRVSGSWAAIDFAFGQDEKWGDRVGLPLFDRPDGRGAPTQNVVGGWPDVQVGGLGNVRKTRIWVFRRLYTTMGGGGGLFTGQNASLAGFAAFGVVSGSREVLVRGYGL